MQPIDQRNGDRQVDLNQGAFILADKPHGLTSFEVIKTVREAYNGYVKKIGHAGTLDPMATGLLIICTGPATKRIEQFQELPKTYTGTFAIGAETPSLDAETPIERGQPAPITEPGQWHQAAQDFLGEHMQTPPAYSAVKVKGKRAYREAHQGKQPEVRAKPVTIEQFTISDVQAGYAHFHVVASKGTYVRSLIRDLAYTMGTFAYLTGLRREAIGEYHVADALSLEAIRMLFREGKIPQLS